MPDIAVSRIIGTAAVLDHHGLPTRPNPMVRFEAHLRLMEPEAVRRVREQMMVVVRQLVEEIRIEAAKPGLPDAMGITVLELWADELYEIVYAHLTLDMRMREIEWAPDEIAQEMLEELLAELETDRIELVRVDGDEPPQQVRVARKRQRGDC